MTLAIPLIDLEAAEGGDRAQLDAIRAATEDFGAVQVVNHGVPEELAADLSARMARLLSLPRAEKARLLEHADDSAVTVLAQEGDYEGLQVQGPGGGWIPVPVIPGALQVFSGHLLARWTGGRLRPGRHRVVAGGTVTRRSTAVFVYPALDTVVGPLPPFAAGSADPPVPVWDHVKDRVAGYLAEYGRPEQIAAWHDGQPYVPELAENSAGR